MYVVYIGCVEKTRHTVLYVIDLVILHPWNIAEIIIRVYWKLVCFILITQRMRGGDRDNHATRTVDKRQSYFFIFLFTIIIMNLYQKELTVLTYIAINLFYHISKLSEVRNSCKADRYVFWFMFALWTYLYLIKIIIYHYLFISIILFSFSNLIFKGENVHTLKCWS